MGERGDSEERVEDWYWMTTPLTYAVWCGDAVHTIPAFGHEVTDEGDLVIHGREDHRYGPDDYELFMWADSAAALQDTSSRIKLAPRLSE